MSCGGGDDSVGPRPPPPPPPPPVATSIALDPESISLSYIGETEQLTALIRDQYGDSFNATPTWTSSNESIALVRDGTVTAVAEGTATITAAFQSLSATARATVDQIPASVSIVSGDNQSGMADSALSEPIVAMVADSGGHAIAGEVVTFTPAEGNGAVSATTVSTDREGLASTVWTLGDSAGPQSLNVTVAEGLSARVAATGLHPPLVAPGEVEIHRLDTTLVLLANQRYGDSWSFEVAGSVPWLSEHPVGTVRRLAAPPGLAIDVANPGFLTIEAWAPGIEQRQTVSVRVAPPSPIIYGIRQESWPDDDAITLLGYAVDRIPLPFLQVDGDPLLRTTGDSAAVVLRQSPLAGSECSGAHVGSGTLRILGAELRAGQDLDLAVHRLKGPVAHLGVGETARFEGGDVCIRIAGQRGAGYALAAVDRTYIDEASATAEQLRYSGGDLYFWTMQDSSGAEPVARYARVRRPEAARHAERRDEIRAWSGPGSGLPVADGRAATTPLEVGEEFEYDTMDGRRGTYRVMGLYEPNVVLAVFVADTDIVWSNKPSRQAEMDSLFQRLAESEVQDLYKTIFGPEPPRTNAESGQMLVLYHRQSRDTGLFVHNIDGDLRLGVIYFGHAPSGADDNRWYLGLMAHEFAHAWQQYNYQRFSTNWSDEGMANLFADEELRLRAGLPLDANVDPNRPIRGSYLRLPYTGDFAAGYSESHPYLRFLVQRLINQHGQPYGESIRRVFDGAAGGWYGYHWVRWGAWGDVRHGPGLVDRMREVIPDWDPVESRLDWMIAFALDDRSSFDEYRNPYIANTWQAFGPWYEFRVGSGSEIHGDANLGGNHYYLLDNSEGIPVSIRHQIREGDPQMVWKVFRYR